MSAASKGSSFDEAAQLPQDREWWAGLLLNNADMAFETDTSARFTFLAPEVVLGWRKETLLNQPAELLLAATGGTAASDIFLPPTEPRRQRVWLRCANGSVACVLMIVAPLKTANGELIGARGFGINLTEDDAASARMAAELRRNDVLEYILASVRKRISVSHMLQAAVEALAKALHAEGAAMIDAHGAPKTARSREVLRHLVGTRAEAVVKEVLALLGSAVGTAPLAATAKDGRPLLLALCPTGGDAPAALLAWRAPYASPFDADDQALLFATGPILGVLQELEAARLKINRQARHDSLTGVLGRYAFLEEISRRMERLERDRLPGTLLYLNIDDFKMFNVRRGKTAGEDVLHAVVALLRAVFRPTDLLARLGGDVFAAWLDGADELAAAERAETLRRQIPQVLAELCDTESGEITLSISIATRWPGTPEDGEALLLRAEKTMAELKRSARGQWRVAHPSKD